MVPRAVKDRWDPQGLNSGRWNGSTGWVGFWPLFPVTWPPIP